MTADVADRAIDLMVYLARGARSLDLTFTGGEPLLAQSLVTHSIQYAGTRAREEGIEPHFGLKTNGTIMNSDVVSVAREHTIDVYVSIDGTADAHDEHRLTKDGRRTHANVVHNAATLLREGIRCIAAYTVHPKSARSVLRGLMQLEDIGFDRIHIAPAYGTVRWTPHDIRTFEQSLMEVANHVRRRNVEGCAPEVRPIERASEHIGGTLKNVWGCGAGSTNLAFLPDGRVTGCSALAMLLGDQPHLSLGDVDNGLDQASIDRLIALAGASDAQRPSCQVCRAADHCTGGCLAINYSTRHGPFAPPEVYCRTIVAIPIAWRRAWASGR